MGLISGLRERKQTLLIIGGVLLTAALGGYFASSSLQQESVRLPLVEGCPLHLQPCSTPLPEGGRIEFELIPKNPSPAEPMEFVARIRGGVPDAVTVLFEGREMYMGFLQYPLHLQESQETEGMTHFKGRGSLSVCVRTLMEWTALVKVRVGDTLYEVPFEFETIHLKQP